MAKVFTITSGLENMGAMKTGGQGSVYKGRRVGEIITAIKLLPTPIYSESEDDKNFRDFENEVQKLKTVNQEPNPNVVKILSSGLSETGNFPFIEMAYIEGPDLEELLKPPHAPVFTIKEVIKVAEQLSNALAHCHKHDVKHGDIKSNNVKYNVHTGNYVLLDFGLAIMSDEQRRTSLRHAGAVEFMAPEQNEGQMLFQTDVYSFGVVMFELLGGRVPFPLQDKGETARNNVRLAHLEAAPPDVLAIRREMLPKDWSREKKEQEMLVPAWLISMIYKCLMKKPSERFPNGIELHDYITHNSIHASANSNIAPAFDGQSEKLKKERDQLQYQIDQYREQLDKREKELERLRSLAAYSGDTERSSSYNGIDRSAKKGVSKSSFIALLLLTIGLAGFSAYSYFKNSGEKDAGLNSTVQSTPVDTTTQLAHEPQKAAPKKKDTVTNNVKITDSAATAQRNTNAQTEEIYSDTVSDTYQNGKGVATANSFGKYAVLSKAYFYNSPDESTRREAFIVSANNAVLTPSDEMEDFVYVTYTNAQGQTSRGWLRKQDLKPVNK